MTPDFNDQLKIIAPLLSPAGCEITIAGLKGSAPAYLLSRLFPEVEGTFLIVTADSDSAEELYRELCFYGGGKDSVLYFPPWDTSPFEQASPHPGITGQRLNALFRLMEGKARGVVAPIAAVIQKVLPQRAVGEVSQYLMAGEETEREELLAKLVKLGYGTAPLVEDPGTFAVRGGILDIFPPNLPLPVRIEFFGDFVDTIRAFDPVSQRSLHPLSELVLLPSREVLLPDREAQEFAARLKERCDALGLPAARRRELLEQLQNAIYPPGIEYLQPIFHPDLTTLFDYTGAATVLTLVDPAAIAAAEEGFRAELAAAEQRALEREL
ncbi:MAG: transcription-repair coupling factor, partial [Geobacteraceae bacterium]|nr:transcription-repair coupling factor [Geobacteraceae bacterium]